MKTDKELIKIWENKEKSFVETNEYENLPLKEKERIFDLIVSNKVIINKVESNKLKTINCKQQS